MEKYCFLLSYELIFFYILNCPITSKIIYRGHMAPLPPSTGKFTPVIKELLDSSARNSIAWATSSTVPGRPKACVSLQCSKN